jgi:creatinine amidohydrolase
MHISSCNWSQVEAYLQNDDRCVLPIGCTEQHSYLSLSTDSILAEKIALDAAAPLGIPVFPVVHYGVTPLFMAYPGTVTIRPEIMTELVLDILSSLQQHGFRRVLIVNGHGGNIEALDAVELRFAAEAAQLKVHHWWKAPLTWKQVQEIDPLASHASWMENFAWTRLEGVVLPDVKKPMVDRARLGTMSPLAARELLGDGNFGGAFQKTDGETNKLWEVGVLEARGLLEDWSGVLL